MEQTLGEQFEAARPELASYLGRLVVRPQIADELVQTTFLHCLEAADRLPASTDGRRAWLFKVATHLAFDELRRHSNWRETMLLDLRVATEASQAMVDRSLAMVGSPETKAIAREHVVACLACTLRNLPERKAAALLLKEVHGFTVDEVADLLDATPAQAKNWLQEARAHMVERYGATCALMAKTGVCHQCVELDGFFGADQGNPLAHDAGIDARLRLAARLRETPPGPWHRMIFGLIDEMA